MGLTSSTYPVTIERGIRNLILGRVLLKEDADVGDATLLTGMEYDSPWDQMNIPGTALFKNNTVEATVVQPAAADAPGSIEHSEAITLVEPDPGQLHLTIDGVLANAYTTARGAYVRLTTLPSYVSTLQMIEEDFVDAPGLPAPEEREFPCVLVAAIDTRLEQVTNVSFEETHRILVRYHELMDTDYDRQTFKLTVEAIADMLMEDMNLGGTTWEAHLQVFTWGGTNGINRQFNRVVETKNGVRVDWADIGIVARRRKPYDKVSA